MRISDWSSDVCSSDLHHSTRNILIIPERHPAVDGKRQGVAEVPPKGGSSIADARTQKPFAFADGERSQEESGEPRADREFQRDAPNMLEDIWLRTGDYRQTRLRSEERRVGKEGRMTCRSRG